ncbi:MAG: S9 family peptidase [Anaerolineales bacterium]
MKKKKPAPYGAWESPITSDMLVSDAIRLGAGILDNEDIYWLEGRPQEHGRSVIVKRAPDGATMDVNPPPFNARTRVHEYGGGSFLVDEGVVYFTNFADQRLYRVTPGDAPVPITPESEAKLRYADGIVDHRRQRIICVREDHRGGGEAANTIAAIPLEGGSADADEQQTLVAGNDFYATPRISPDGQRLLWLTWQHPNMPWDGTELWVGAIQEDGSIGDARHIAGGERESIFQPAWAPDGAITFVSDRSGWWNLYRWQEDHAECLVEMEAEFGLPQWVFGMTTYDYLSATEIICTYTQEGIWRLARLDLESHELTPIDLPYTTISSPHASREGKGDKEGKVLLRVGAADRPTALILFDPQTEATTTLRKAHELKVDPDYLSTPEPIEFPTTDDKTAHALFYPPQNPEYEAPEDEKPPLLVISHGGPTAATNSALDMSIQYWTSRGIAVLDVNYGGSTGYGRAYRERLNEQWGIVDVDDCVNGAHYLVEQGRVDGDRLAIRGGSAGGYTTLSALAFRDLFHAGASYYGVSDLEALATDTHKFESRYLDNLVGPYPETRDRYVERSPIHHIEGLNCPIIFFQGLEDAVVPPSQAEQMVDALREKGIPVAYLPFEGEQHGFRQAEHIKRAIDAELYFYGQIFGFEPADEIEPVTIENLDATEH